MSALVIGLFGNLVSWPSGGAVALIAFNTVVSAATAALLHRLLLVCLPAGSSWPRSSPWRSCSPPTCWCLRQQLRPSPLSLARARRRDVLDADVADRTAARRRDDGHAHRAAGPDPRHVDRLPAAGRAPGRVARAAPSSGCDARLPRPHRVPPGRLAGEERPGARPLGHHLLGRLQPDARADPPRRGRALHGVRRSARHAAVAAARAAWRHQRVAARAGGARRGARRALRRRELERQLRADRGGVRGDRGQLLRLRAEPPRPRAAQRPAELRTLLAADRELRPPLRGTVLYGRPDAERVRRSRPGAVRARGRAARTGVARRGPTRTTPVPAGHGGRAHLARSVATRRDGPRGAPPRADRRHRGVRPLATAGIVGVQALRAIALLVCGAMYVYVATLSSVVDYGENMRFRLGVEPLVGS